jgi:hypothetical protein
MKVIVTVNFNPGEGLNEMASRIYEQTVDHLDLRALIEVVNQPGPKRRKRKGKVPESFI